MNTRPALRIRYAGRWCAYVSGHGSRELLTELRNGRVPQWSSTARAWAVRPATATDLLALAESRGRVVLVTDDDQPGGAGTGGAES